MIHAKSKQTNTASLNSSTPGNARMIVGLRSLMHDAAFLLPQYLQVRAGKTDTPAGNV